MDRGRLVKAYCCFVSRNGEFFICLVALLLLNLVIGPADGWSSICRSFNLTIAVLSRCPATLLVREVRALSSVPIGVSNYTAVRRETVGFFLMRNHPGIAGEGYPSGSSHSPLLDFRVTESFLNKQYGAE